MTFEPDFERQQDFAGRDKQNAIPKRKMMAAKTVF